jgi:predicted helicase
MRARRHVQRPLSYRGVDVPAVDMVAFLPRRSRVDIV